MVASTQIKSERIEGSSSIFVQVTSITLLSPTDICLGILSLNIVADTPKNGVPADVSAVMGAVHFPVFDRAELDKIKAMIKRRKLQVDAVLTDCGYTLQFAPELLTRLALIRDFGDNYPFFACLALHSFLVWMITFKKEMRIDYLRSVLRLLLVIVTPTEHRDSDVINELALSAFYRGFEDYLSFPRLIDFPDFSDMLSQYFSNHRNLPESALTLLPQCIASLIKTDKATVTQTGACLMTYIGVVAEEMSFKFPVHIADCLLENTTYLIAELDVIALGMLAHLIHRASLNGLLKIFGLLPRSFCEQVLSNGPFIVVDGIGDVFESPYPEKSPTAVSLSFVEESVFTNGLLENATTSFPERLEFAKIMPKTVLQALSLIVNAAPIRPECVQFLLDSFSVVFPGFDTRPQFGFDLAIIYAFLCHHLGEHTKLDSFVDIITSPPFLTPGLNVFSPNESYPYVNSVRVIVFDLIVSHGGEYIGHVLQKWMRYPLLLGEICYRFASNREIADIHESLIPKLSKTLVNLSLYYQQCVIDESNKKEIETVRTAIFVFMAQILRSQRFTKVLFNNDYFVSFFCSFLFEKPLRPFVISHVRQYLTHGENLSTGPLVNTLSQIFHICAMAFPDENAVLLTEEVLHLLSDVLIYNRQMSQHFQRLLDCIFPQFTALLPGESSRMFLLQALQFLSVASGCEQLASQQIASLESAIENCFVTNIPPQLSLRLIQLIAGECVASQQPFFVIRQPKILQIYLKMALRNNTVLEAISFINGLCIYSSRNCELCHSSGLDLFIIDTLSTLPNEDPEVTKHLLVLFEKIATVISSVAVVHRYISLLALVDGKIPARQLLYISALNSIVSYASQVPAGVMILQDSAQLELKNIDFEDIKNGFTLMAWLYVEELSGDYDPDLFTLVDSKGSRFRVFFTSAGCFYALHRDGNEAIGKIDVKLVQRTWFNLAIHCNIQEHQIVGFVNCHQGKQREMPELGLVPGDIKVIVGGNSPVYVHPVKVGPLGLFGDATKDQIASVYGLGPHLNGKLTCDAIFFLQPQWAQQKMSFLAKRMRSGVVGKIVKSSRTQASSFTDVLIRICKVETLIPLFAQLMATPPVEGFFPMFLTSIVNVLSQALLASEQGQESFSRANGCSVLSKFLTTMADEFADYQIYLQFASLMQSVSYPPLQKDLVQRILFNPEIWLKCDPESHLRVLRHWTRTLMPSLMGSANQFLSFDVLLYFLRVYYWYEPVEEPLASMVGRTRGMELNVSECRQLLNQIAVVIATTSFTKADLDLLMSHCLTLVENKQVIDLLAILNMLISHNPSPLSRIPDLDLTSFLFPLFSTDCVLVYISALDVLWTACEYGFIPRDTVEAKLGRSLEQMHGSIIGDKLLDGLCQYMLGRRFYGLLRHCFYCAAVLGPDSLLSLTDRLEPRCDYTTYRNWMFLPVLAAFHVNFDKATKQVFTFLVQCDHNSWNGLFDLVFLCGQLFGQYDKYFAMLIDAMSECLLCADDLCGFDDYVECCRSFWFFRPMEHSSSILNHAFRNCCAVEWRMEDTPCWDKSVSRNSMMDHFIMGTVLLDTFLNFRFPEVTFRFGLRFGDSGEWLDRSSALKFAGVLLRFNKIRHVRISMLVYSFLCLTDCETVRAHLHVAELTREEMNSDSFSLVDKRYTAGDGNRVLNRDYHETLLISFEKLESLATDDPPPLTVRSQAMLASIQAILRDELNWFPDFSDLMVQSLEKIRDFRLQIKNESVLREKVWQRLWRSLATDRGPWGKTFPSTAHYDRDFTSCSFFCPAKLKRNWKFDDHTDAALARVTGHVVKKLDNGTQNPKIKAIIRDEASEVESNVILSANCIIVNPRIEKKALFVLHKSKIRFIYKDFDYFKDWPLNEMKYIFFRRRYHLPNSIEFFTIDGKNVFVYFPDEDALPILSKISTLSMPNLSLIQTQPFLPFFKANSQTDKWVKGEISNFQYLMHLNMMSGRSFNDLSQYPFLPWVFSDYTSDTLDLSDPDIYRNFEKPIGALGDERLKELLQRMPQLAQFEEPYLYGSSHICMLTACLYLIRLEPFTSQHIALQSGRFDQSSRIFHSIPDCWRIVTTLLNDYRELVPEFFFQPECLVNFNRFDFGENAFGVVDDVGLPPWADSPYSFVYLQRKGLESDFVSRALSSWIDLVWGYKQRGEEARKAYNVFKSDMYDDAWEGKDLNDPVVRTTIQTTLFHVGQIPPQLFTEKHPCRVVTDSPALLSDIYSVNVRGARSILVSFTEKVGNFAYDIVILDSLGSLIIYHFDFHRLYSQKKRTKSLSYLDELQQDTGYIKSSITHKEVKCFGDYEINTDVYAVMPNRVIVLLEKKDRRILATSVSSPVIRPYPLSVSRPFSVVSHKEYLAIAGKDAVLTIFRGSATSPHAVMPSYRDCITCSCVNGEFQVVVIGTSDGYLLVNSLNKGSTVRVLTLGGAVPVKVLVTESWGFILCYATMINRGRLDHALFLFSINGEQLKQISIDFPVAEWSSWASKKAFDYVVLSDDRGRLFCFEVFFMNIGSAIFRCHSPVSSVSFASDIKCIVAVTKSGKIIFIPHDVEGLCL